MNKKYITFALASILLTACGGGSSSSSSSNDGEGAIDLREYFPKTSMSKTFISTEKDGDAIDKSHYVEIINVTGETITYTEDANVIEKVLFTDKNITTTSIDGNESEVDVRFRHVDLGDTLFSKKIEFTEDNDLGKITTTWNRVCKLKSKETKFEKDDNIYTGDLLKIECISDGKIIYDVKQAILDAGAAEDLNGTHPIYDKSYIYLQKDLGNVVYINDDCITNVKLPMVVNDKASSTECKKIQYDYEFYLP